jgi:hypothetical protein
MVFIVKLVKNLNKMSRQGATLYYLSEVLGQRPNIRRSATNFSFCHNTQITYGIRLVFSIIDVTGVFVGESCGRLQKEVCTRFLQDPISEIVLG